MLSDRDRIEESHGMWELAIVRLAALVEAGANKKIISEAVEIERSTFKTWKKATDDAVENIQ